jgi:hypothetical protein
MAAPSPAYVSMRQRQAFGMWTAPSLLYSARLVIFLSFMDYRSPDHSNATLAVESLQYE